MHWFQLQIHSIPYLTEFLLSLAITGYLLGVEKKQRDARYLTLVFSGFSLLFLNLFAAVSVSASWQFYFPSLHPVFFMWIGTTLIQFSYFFVANPFERESKLVWWLTVVPSVGVAVYVLGGLGLHGPRMQVSVERASLVFALMQIWSLVVLLRKTLCFSRVEEDLPADLPWTRRFTTGLGWIARPPNRKAQAQLDFARVFLILVLIATFAVVCLHTRLLSNSQLQYATSPGILIFLLSAALVYFSHAPERTTFQIKLVGLSLVTMLSVLGIISLGIYSRSELVRTAGAELPDRQTLRFSPVGDGYSVQPIPFQWRQPLGTELTLGDNASAQVDLDFDFPLYGRVRRQIFVNENGLVTFDRPLQLDMANVHLGSPYFYSVFYDSTAKIAPLFLDFKGPDPVKVKVYRQAEELRLTWSEVIDDHDKKVYNLQLCMWSDGSFATSMEQLRGNRPFGAMGGVRGITAGDDGPPILNVNFGAMGASGSGRAAAQQTLVQDHRLLYRQFSHRKILRPAVLVILATLFVIFVFPYFFQANLIRPLGALLEGVEQVNQGRRDTRVPIRFNDEIGFLTANFNTMARSIHAAEQKLGEHARDLEDRVRERTRELEASLNELTRTQDRLNQAEKMAALGRLTSGVAHEMKNPLNFISNFSNLSVDMLDEVKETLDEGETHRDAAETLDYVGANMRKIHEHSLRADRIVSTMMAHSQGTFQELELFDLHQILREALDVARREWKKHREPLNLEVFSSYDPSIEEVKVAGQALSLAFKNLFENAFFALEDKQTGSPGEEFSPAIWLTTRRLNEAVEVEVRDNGVGIAEEHLDRVFEPFFTTRSPSSNSIGMGLSLSYDTIVGGHGGSLTVESLKGAHTVFRVTLPAVA